MLSRPYILFNKELIILWDSGVRHCLIGVEETRVGWACLPFPLSSPRLILTK